MHDGPIVTWKNGDPIAPAVVSDVDADAGVDDIVTLDPPLIFLLFLSILMTLMTLASPRLHLSLFYRPT